MLPRYLNILLMTLFASTEITVKPPALTASTNLTLLATRAIVRNIKLPNLYNQEDPLFVYKWFLNLNLQYNENGSPGTQDVTIHVLDSIRFQYDACRDYNSLKPSVIEEVLKRYNLLVDFIDANLDNGVEITEVTINRVILLRELSLKRLTADRRALYKDIKWKSGQDLIKGAKRSLTRGLPVIWLWSSRYISSLSLGQQGSLVQDLRCLALKGAEKDGVDLETISTAFKASYLALGLPVGSRHQKLNALNNGSIDDIGYLSFSDALLYGKVWKDNGYVL
ncbi:hypothetical protein JCM3774_005349 [Rhodotorula dairenensis]